MVMNKLFTIILFLPLAANVCGQTGNKSLLKYSTPLVVGHRGGFDAVLPENSIPMFEYTHEKACRKPVGIEFDIRESASGSLYIMHDSTVDRTTNGTGKITVLTDAYLESLSLRDRNGKLTATKIPLFSEVLDYFRDKNIILMLDVKGNLYPKVIDMVVQKHMQEKCILLTFSIMNTELVKETTKEIMISALVQDQRDWESICKLQIPSKQLIAYLNRNAPAELVNEIKHRNVTLMTDVSEGLRNKGKWYDAGYYSDFAASLHLGIIISDYPVYVSNTFCTK